MKRHRHIEEDVFAVTPSRERMLPLSRFRKIRELAERAGEAKLRDLYRELYGAEPGSTLTEERLRGSLREACDELLGRAS